MKILYNSQIEVEENLNLTIYNRSFQYGDGLFETIILKNTEPRFIEDHVLRLHAGMNAFSMNIPLSLHLQSMKDMISQISTENKLPNARVKILVWRKWGGLFTPSNNDVDFVIQAQALQSPNSQLKENAAFSEDIKILPGKTTLFKTCSALPYVLAGIEKEKRNLDEILIADHEGNIAEASSSNIWWVKDDEYFTPSLDTGCIDGIMRKNMMKVLKGNGFQVTEIKAKKDELMNADQLFTSNVAGIIPIGKVENKLFNTNLNPIFKSLLE